MSKKECITRAANISKWLLFILGVVAVGSLILAEWHGLWNMGLIGYDYGFFYYAFKVVLHHQPALQLYNLSLQQAYMARCHFPFLPHNQYVYPPQFALIFSPFGLLPFSVSTVLWMVTSTVSYGLAISWMVRMLWPTLRRGYLVVIFVGAISMTPFEMDIAVGNVNSILFAAITLTFYLLVVRKNPWWAGVPLGVAVVLKVTPLAIVIYFLLRKQWKVTISAAVTILTVSALTALQLGAGSLVYYGRHFLSFGETSMKNGPAPYNQSLLGVLGLFVQHHWIFLSTLSQQILYYGYVVAAALVILYAVRRTKADWRVDMPLACLTPIMFSPLVEQMHMLYALPAIFILGRRAQDLFSTETSPNHVKFALLGLAIGCCALLSLLGTFFINTIVIHCPRLFWLQTGMFWVSLTVFLAAVLVALRSKTVQVYLGRTGPNISGD